MDLWPETRNQEVRTAQGPTSPSLRICQSRSHSLVMIGISSRKKSTFRTQKRSKMAFPMAVRPEKPVVFSRLRCLMILHATATSALLGASETALSSAKRRSTSSAKSCYWKLNGTELVSFLLLLKMVCVFQYLFNDQNG